MTTQTRLLTIILMIATPLAPTRAYNVFPYDLGGGEVGYSKWGDNHAGTPGGVVTWSLMPNGTPLHSTAPDYIHGTSNLDSVFAQVGGQATALTLIQNALDGWAQAANITFLYVGVDDGTPFNAPYAHGQVVGDIRIGAFEIDGFSAAVGYAAPPNGGTTLEGDVILNNKFGISYYNAPGAEGELYDLFPPGGGFYRNEFTGLLTHELGHALGLDHSEVPTGCMCGYVSSEFDGGECAYFDQDGDGRVPINRLPDADDVAGIQFLYGPALDADFDGDDDVDGADFLSWQRGVGLTGTATKLDGDADGDHDVDEDDLTAWRGRFAAATPAIGAVPEPHVGALLLTALICLSARRVRRKHLRHATDSLAAPTERKEHCELPAIRLSSALPPENRHNRHPCGIKLPLRQSIPGKQPASTYARTESARVRGAIDREQRSGRRR